MDKVIRIAGASGSWGDSPSAIGQVLTADVDYLMMDYLAEVTMSLLARARLKDPASGFPPDVIGYLRPHLAEIKRRGIRVVTNGGGVNPLGCRDALVAAAEAAGVDLTVAVVLGDDVMPEAARLRAEDVRDLYSGEAFPEKLLTANAYLGALPIVRALASGADIVLTGRCADSALALAILMHEFGWDATDYDRLAAGSLVGHVLECGPQATGGTHTDWDKVPGWENIGYPIASCHADGTFSLGKPEGTGGLITPGVVSEQILYEVGDPGAYLLPDVTADFSGVSVVQSGPDQVFVSGAKGRAPSARYKVSATWQDGYRATLLVSIVGPDAAAKALRTGEAMIARAERLMGDKGMKPFTATHLEALGAEASYGRAPTPAREVILRLVVEHADRAALDLMAREAGSIGLSFAPGTTGLIGGRPKATPVIRMFSFLIDKADLPAPVVVSDDQEMAVEIPVPTGVAADIQPDEPQAAGHEGETVSVPLKAIAFTRSGDKGNASNIAVIARRAEFYPYLLHIMTPDKIAAHFAPLVKGQVTRFAAPGLCAVNFLLEDALGGGGMASRRIDPQGKAFGQMASELVIPVPRTWVAEGWIAGGAER